MTLQVENDAVSTLRGTSDQYYTSGLRLGWTSGTNEVPSFLQTRPTRSGATACSASAWTSRSPSSRRATRRSYNPPLTDRPYAGVLGLTGSLIHDTGNARTVLA